MQFLTTNKTDFDRQDEYLFFSLCVTKTLFICQSKHKIKTEYKNGCLLSGIIFSEIKCHTKKISFILLLAISGINFKTNNFVMDCLID